MHLYPDRPETAAMVGLNLAGDRSVSAEVIATLAFYAAETGAQYGFGRLFPLTGAAAVFAATVINPPALGLAGGSAMIACSGPVVLNRHDDHRLTSTGSGDHKATGDIQVGARTS